MKIFKGPGQIRCPYCMTWIPLQRLVRVPKNQMPPYFGDGAPSRMFSRAYKCPRCDCVIYRYPKAIKAIGTRPLELLPTC
jgi:hypothetical protein